MEYMLTFHTLKLFVDKTQPHQFKFTFNEIGLFCHSVVTPSVITTTVTTDCYFVCQLATQLMAAAHAGSIVLTLDPQQFGIANITAISGDIVSGKEGTVWNKL